MRKNKIIVFLVLPKLFSLEKTIFATTSGLNTYVQNTASSNCSKSCNSVIPYDFSKQCTCGLPFFTPTFSLETFHAHIIFIVCIYCTYILFYVSVENLESKWVSLNKLQLLKTLRDWPSWHKMLKILQRSAI